MTTQTNNSGEYKGMICDCKACVKLKGGVPSQFLGNPNPSSDVPKAEILKPIIDWLIDEIQSNQGHSPLIDFNKKRLKQAITDYIKQREVVLLNKVIALDGNPTYAIKWAKEYLAKLQQEEQK